MIFFVCCNMIEVFGFDVSRLSGVGLWIGFWFVANAVCYWFVGAFVTRSKEQGRLALRAVSIVHAAMAIPELIQTVEMWNKGLLWPPTVYGASFDSQCVVWYELAAGYYIWDLITASYFRYGIAFVFHGLLSFPVFLFAAIGPSFFLHGFYGRFYHGVFTISTPWLHLRELLIASGREDNVFKKLSEYIFALTFVVVRIVLGTLISLRFILAMSNLMIFHPRFVHSMSVFVISTVSCALITCLQLYWFALEIVPAMKAVFFGSKKKN